MVVIMVTTEWDSVGKKEYSSWLNLANYTNISKCILDRWIYCNQEAFLVRGIFGKTILFCFNQYFGGWMC